jgi:thiol:disulfide interchange protein DsbC
MIRLIRRFAFLGMISFSLAVLMSCAALNKDAAQPAEQTPEQSLKAAFPQLEFEKMSKTPVDGVYEVLTGGRILYYAPRAQCIIAGEIITRAGINLTQAKEMDLLTQRGKQAPLDKALKIGSGKGILVEFTDIDCQYCRAAAHFLMKVENATRYVFFVSLSGNPQTLAKTKYVLCAQDKAKAYEEAMTGKLDDMKFKVCDSKEAEAMLQNHKDVGQKVNPPGTPFFLVNGNPVMGANMPEIVRLLEEGAK